MDNNKNSNKIAFAATVYRHLEAFHLPFMKLLQDKGYEVHAYAQIDDGKTGVESQGIKCHDVFFRRSPFKFSNFKSLRELIISFKKEHFQLIHLHTPVASILGRIAARIAKIPVVVYTAHGFHFFKGAPIHYWLMYYPLERIMARFTDYLITINVEDYKRAQHFSVRQEVIYVPGVGIDTQSFLMTEESIKKTNQMLDIKEEAFIILCVAELNKNKNQIQLIKAIQKMVKNEKSIQCIFVGSGKDEDYLRTQVRKRGLESNIHFCGFREDVAALMRMADVITLLSRREGLPKSLMEAMASGRPIVTTNIRGNRDLVVDGETGYLVPVSDTNATIVAHMKLFYEPMKRADMGIRNRELATQYDIKQILYRMENIYERALGKLNQITM